ncbi:hypothetical protein, partial [Baaleninema sp.]|uniref:hypothetical protein n=1 Tax=Baaleninema sp. TaxID=3101197 RepID=UPI003CFE40E7
LSHANHKQVRYEDLVSDTEAVLTDLCEFLEIECNETLLQQMLQGYGTAANGVVLSSEPWKSGVKASSQTLTSSNGTKFEKLFDIPQRTYIVERLAPVKKEDEEMRG